MEFGPLDHFVFEIYLHDPEAQQDGLILNIEPPEVPEEPVHQFGDHFGAEMGLFHPVLKKSHHLTFFEIHLREEGKQVLGVQGVTFGVGCAF